MELGGYTEADLEVMTTQFAARLLRADKAKQAARVEHQRREAGKHAGKRR